MIGLVKLHERLYFL